MNNAELELIRTRILSIAASCARLQHLEQEDIPPDGLPVLGDHAHALKDIYDKLEQLKKGGAS